VRVAKAGIEGRQAELLADLEDQLAAEYRWDDEAWAEVTAEAKRAVAEADEAIAKRCADLGIRPEFRPGLQVSWYGRGENASKNRRAELRKVAQTRLAALAKMAKVAIDKDALERETTLVAGALSSAEAKDFLEAMPTLEALMPRIALAELEESRDTAVTPRRSLETGD
jgi:hypothetical protein